MIIVVILVSFNFMSNSFFLNNIQNEIVNTSQANLNTTVNDYENHILSIKKFGMSLHVNENAKLLNGSTGGQINSMLLYRIRNELQSMLADSYLMIDNIIYLLGDQSIVIEKEGTRTFEEMFVNYYGNEVYTKDFWLQELAKPYSFKLFPESSFFMNSFGQQIHRGQFIPVLVKNQFNPQFSLIILLNSRSMFASFYQPAKDGKLFISDETGKTIYASDSDYSAIPSSLLASGQKTGYIQQGKNYLYYQVGKETGYTYTSVIPSSQIKAKIVRLNWLLAGFLLLSIAISLVASIFFTKRLNNPIRKILDSIQHHHVSMPINSSIREFDFISEKIKDISQAHHDIRQDLTRKNSLLKNYAYINHLKQIHTNTQDLKMHMAFDTPFVLIGFHLTFRSHNLKQIDIHIPKASFFIRELIHTHISQSFNDSLTFQIEQNLILTLIFSKGDEANQIEEHLQRLRKIFDMDQLYCLITITVSPHQTDPTAFTETYGHILRLLESRKLGEDAQIIPFSTKVTGDIPEDWERNELQAHMEAGNEKELLRIGRKMLALLEKKEASVEYFVRFAQTFSQQLLKNFSPAERDRLLETIQDEKPHDCYTLEAFDRYLEQLVAAACILYDHKKDQTDPICDFVLTYIHNHYGDDISLDIISDHLKITSSYLSTYFKEKMGMNFSDYVQTYRMKKAAELLETSELKVNEVAQRVGYLSVNSFIRNFKKFTGYPPGEYRKRN